MSQRDIKKEIFVYQSINALREIRTYCVENNCTRDLAGIKNTYVTLCEVATNNKSDTFKSFISSIATLGCMSEKTCSKHLKVLKEIQLIDLPVQEVGRDGKFKKIEITLNISNYHRRKLLRTVKEMEESPQIDTPSEVISTSDGNDFSSITGIKNQTIEPNNRTSINTDLPKGKKPKVNWLELYPFLKDEKVKESLKNFKEHRQTLRKPLNDYSTKLILNKLKNLAKDNTDLMVQIIDQAIERGWLSVFKLDKEIDKKVSPARPRLDFENIDAKEKYKKYLK
jgi:hypothetical protein